MKYLGALFVFICLALPAQAQTNCKVLDSDIAGSYAGACKDGLAHGKGTAKGKDAYEGDFIAGWPHGKGTYKWASGNSYTGDWQQWAPRNGPTVPSIPANGKRTSRRTGKSHFPMATSMRAASKPMVSHQREELNANWQAKSADQPASTSTRGGFSSARTFSGI